MEMGFAGSSINRVDVTAISLRFPGATLFQIQT
jgi:hypothetical protein